MFCECLPEVVVNQISHSSTVLVIDLFYLSIFSHVIFLESHRLDFAKT